MTAWACATTGARFRTRNGLAGQRRDAVDPHRLVEALRATLDETAQADLLLHVGDASAPERDEQIEQVERVLREIGADEVPTILVLNKIDLLDRSPEVQRDPCGSIARLSLSASSGVGVDALRDALVERVRSARAGAVAPTEEIPDVQPLPSHALRHEPVPDRA